MSNTYINARFPEEIAVGAVGGPAFQNLVVRTDNAHEVRSAQWEVGRYKFDVSQLKRDPSEANKLRDLFYCAFGRRKSFRFKDWNDFEAVNEDLKPTGAKTVQLIKTYTNGGVSYVRNIYKPVTSPAVTLRRNSSPFTAFTLDYESGEVLLTADVVRFITNIAQAAVPTVTTSAAHGYSTGDKIWIQGVGGMTQINDRVVTILSTPTTTTFTIDVDSSGFNAYTSGGTASKYVQPSEDLDWTGEFDVPMRLDTDELNMEQVDVEWREWSNIPLIEDPEAPTPVHDIPDLLALALADGATQAYAFDEASGNIIDHAPGGAHPFTAVAANVMRLVAGISGPDELGITTDSANGSSPDFGHCRGTHPSLHGQTQFSLEAVFKVPLNKSGGVVHMDSGDGFTSVGFSADAGTGAVRADISVQGQPFNSQLLATAANNITTTYKHCVLTWDGLSFKGYLQGSQVFSVNIGGGSSGIYNPSSTKLAVGGTAFGGTSNVNLTIEFLALYNGIVLNATQVQDHFEEAGT